MARIKGVAVPDHKHVVIALTSIHGIGNSRAQQICEDAKVDPTKKVKDLSNDELNAVRDQLDKYTIEGDLRRDVSLNIKTKMEINSHEGTRHRRGLPVRGQRTSRNARTRKGKPTAIANKKK